MQNVSSHSNHLTPGSPSGQYFKKHVIPDATKSLSVSKQISTLSHSRWCMGFQPLDGLTGYFLLPLTVLIVVSLTYLFFKEDNMWNAFDEASRDAESTALITDPLGHSEEPRTLRGQRFLPFLPFALPAIPAIPLGLAAAGAGGLAAAGAAAAGGLAAAATAATAAAGLAAPVIEGLMPAAGDVLNQGYQALTDVAQDIFSPWL